MNPDHRQHNERTGSPDESVYDNKAPVQLNRFHFQLSDKTVAVIALIFASMALMGMLWAISEAHEASRHSEIATMRVEGLTRALIAHGIKDTYPHVPGEDD